MHLRWFTQLIPTWQRPRDNARNYIGLANVVVRSLNGLMPSETKRIALYSVWAVLSIVSVFLALSPFLVPHAELLSLAGWFKAAHPVSQVCPLCGMSRAYILLSEGRLEEASTYNALAPWLYGATFLNFFAASASIFVWRRSLRVIRRR